MRTIRRVASSVPEIFGFLVLALILSTEECRLNRLKAQDDGEYAQYPNPCTEEHLRAIWGDDWHIGYMLSGCWMYEPLAPGQKSKPLRPALSRVRFR